MKTVLTMTAVVVLGVAITTTIGLARLGTPLTLQPLVLDLPAEENATGPAAPAKIEGGAAVAAQPKAVAEELEFDFDQLPNKTMNSRHVFKVRNEGQAPLNFKGASVSCNKCTFVDLPEAPIEPGQTGEIVVRWNVDTFEDHFRQSATIGTDDPEQETLHFVISGKVVRPLQIEPKKVVFSSVQVGQPAEAKVFMSAYFNDHLQVLKQTFSDEASTKFFDVAAADVPKDKLPAGAKSGVELTLKLKPGLPVGSFSQELKIQTNLEAEEEVSVPITGEIGGAINIFGTDWERDHRYLNVGNISQSQGDKHTVYVLMHGAEDIELGPPEVNEDVLKVRYGETQALKGGALLKVPVEIEIPPGSPLVNHMGGKAKLAEIIIPTNKSTLGRVKLLIKFAVVAD